MSNEATELPSITDAQLDEGRTEVIDLPYGGAALLRVSEQFDHSRNATPVEVSGEVSTVKMIAMTIVYGDRAISFGLTPETADKLGIAILEAGRQCEMFEPRRFAYPMPPMPGMWAGGPMPSMSIGGSGGLSALDEPLTGGNSGDAANDSD